MVITWFLKKILFIWERARVRERAHKQETGRGRSRLDAGLDPGTWAEDRNLTNWATQGFHHFVMNRCFGESTLKFYKYSATLSVCLFGFGLTISFFIESCYWITQIIMWLNCIIQSFPVLISRSQHEGALMFFWHVLLILWALLCFLA